MHSKHIFTRFLSLALCLTLFMSLFSALSNVEAANKTLLVEQAQRLALASSKEITKKGNEIILKQMKYVEAVKGIQAKVKNLRSFRWTPLLSFKFPEKLNLTEEYELNIKPLNLQTEIETLRHEQSDLKFKVLAEVNKLYTEVYVLQEKITFTSQRLATAESELARNRQRLITGDATQADIEKMQSSVEALTSELSNLKRSFEDKKQKLSEMIGLDVTSGYSFRSSLKVMSLPREKLDWVTQYTLDNDHSFYVAKAAASTALLNVNAYESLMKNQYGSKMNYIQNFINMSKQGLDVDYSAFQLKYKEMLTALDKPWAGSIRILFFRFTKEWFKGEISGTRYIEDEMYAVYTACMEYSSAKKEKDSAEKELRQTVSDSYENLVTAYNAYQSALKLSDKAGQTLDKIIALNKLGKAEYSEVKDARDNYQEMQLEAVNALASYNDLLYEFDRLTCGAVTIYMSGEETASQSGGTGDSFKVLDPISDPYYYIYSSVADMVFHIGVSIPKEFEPSITAFEAWIEGTQVGKRTQLTEELTHLALDYQSSSEITIRLYDGDNYVTECVIDASVPRDVLPIEAASPTEAEKNPQIGTYSVDTTPLDGLSTSKLTIKLNPDVDAKSYSITYGDHGSVYTTEKLPVSESFTYLTLLIASLDDVTLSLYNSAGESVGTAFFDSSTQRIFKNS